MTAERRLLIGFAVASVVLFFWGLGRPSPRLLVFALLLAAPWFGFFALRRVPMDTVKQRLFGVAVALYPIGFALFTRGGADYEPLRWTTMVLLAVLAGLVFADRAALFLMPPQLPWAHAVAALSLAPALYLYSLGALLILNGTLDSAPPRQIRTTVLDKYTARSGTKASYRLRLNGWEGRPADDYVVPVVVFNTLRPGDVICVLRHEGTLGFPWFVLAYCRP